MYIAPPLAKNLPYAYAYNYDNLKNESGFIEVSILETERAVALLFNIRPFDVQLEKIGVKLIGSKHLKTLLSS